MYNKFFLNLIKLTHPLSNKKKCNALITFFYKLLFYTNSIKAISALSPFLVPNLTMRV